MSAVLAIVIPAFRVRHLSETLESFAKQIDRNFRIYVGDDASSDPILACVESFSERLDVVYHRFERNLGSTDLVSHWHRCIEQTTNEPWIWLFSDDDVAEPECVARFREEVSRTSDSIDVFRFGLDFINDASVRFFRPSNHPSHENSDSFLRAILTDESRAWRAQDHIFSRRVYDRYGGFVRFPNAIYSDYATWLQFSRDRGVLTIEGPRVLWRSHPSGTSTGKREEYRDKWVQALCMFVQWLRDYSREQGGDASSTFATFGPRFFYRNLMFRSGVTVAQRRVAIQLTREVFGCAWFTAFCNLQLSIAHYRLWHFIMRLKSKFRI